jgi:hypothetical protein
LCLSCLPRIRALGAFLALAARKIALPLAAAGAIVVSIVDAVGVRIRTAAERSRSIGERLARATVVAGERFAFTAGVAVTRARARAHGEPTAGPGGGVPAGRRAPRGDIGGAFAATVYQNEYLRAEDREIHAIVSVSSVAARDEGAPDHAVVLLLDCSGSMGMPWTKLKAARRATEAAVDALVEGTWFAIVRGSDDAVVAYPPTGMLVQASPPTRAAAKRALRLLWPEGGTALGRWLLAARDLFTECPSAVRRAILLTDGRNESESPESLQAAVAACAGRFQCDCRGIGTDWSVDELRMIASGLLGSVDMVAVPDGLAGDFRAMTEAAMARGVGDVELEVCTPRGASLVHVHQAAPEWLALPTTVHADGRTSRCATGAWGAETREYHLCIGLPQREIGDEMLAARVNVVVERRVATQVLVKAIWSDDERLSTAAHPAVAHHEAQGALVESIGRGLRARGRGDEAAAEALLGRAAELALASGHASTMQLLETVVDVEDATTGIVRLKRDVDREDEMLLDTRSTRTLPLPRDGELPSPEDHGVEPDSSC